MTEASKRQGLMALAERCEQPLDPDTQEVVDLCSAIHDVLPEPKCIQPPSYYHSVDAAMKLVPPGWDWSVEHNLKYQPKAYCYKGTSPLYVDGSGATPALALTVAAIRALAQEEGDG